MSFSRGKILAWAVFLTAVLALLVPVILIERQILAHTEGNPTLPQDESFINIVVGKNLAFYGVWGLSKYAFVPAASSLLYPVALVPVFFIAGAHLVIPLLINLIAAILLLRVVQRELLRRQVAPTVQLAVLLLLIFLPPLPLLVVSGMEYSLFLLFTALFARAFSRGLEEDRLPTDVYVYAGLLVATRIEGFLLVAAACIVLGYQRQRITAVQPDYQRQRRSVILLASAAALPVLLFGSLSFAKGGAFIPSALLEPLGGGIYTAAIIGCALVVVAFTYPYKRQWLASSLLGLIAIIRTGTLSADVIRTSIDTYEQQVQAARFVHRYYYRYGLSLNQPGILSYFSEGRKVDITSVYSDSLSMQLGARMAIVTGAPSGVQPLSPRWGKVASWNNPGNSIFFYASDTGTGRRLKENLREYERRLPAGLRVRYY